MPAPSFAGTPANSLTVGGGGGSGKLLRAVSTFALAATASFPFDAIVSSTTHTRVFGTFCGSTTVTPTSKRSRHESRTTMN